MKGMRAQHRRRAAAALCALVWLLGIEVLPNLHLAFHDPSTHTHTPAGMIVTVTFGEPAHTHAAGSIHSHDAADRAIELASAADRARHNDKLAIDVALVVHDATGLAHRATALHAPAAPLLAPLPAVRLVTNVIASPVGRACVAFVATSDARGPPAA